jgi:hypothetical protein
VKISNLILIFFFFITSFTGFGASVDKGDDLLELWRRCGLENKLTFEIFQIAIKGSSQIENLAKKNVITIIDFSKSSTEKRFFVIDLDNKKLIYNCFVAHGKNSGENIAQNFSNRPESLQSSLGFYLTAETYFGEHGYSLRLDGIEKGINDNARSREIVVHGAEYVSEEFIKSYGRLGRSWGCPALPRDISKEIIDRISGGSCLFIYGNDDFYKANSAFLNKK